MQPAWALPKVLCPQASGALGRGDRVVHQADHLLRRLTGTPVATDTSHALKTGVDLRTASWPREAFAWPSAGGSTGRRVDGGAGPAPGRGAPVSARETTLLQRPGGTSVPGCRGGGAARAAAAVQAVAGPRAGATVLVVAHNTVLRLALCALLDLPVGRHRELFPRLDNAALTELSLPADPDGPASLLSLNVPPRLTRDHCDRPPGRDEGSPMTATPTRVSRP